MWLGAWALLPPALGELAIEANSIQVDESFAQQTGLTALSLSSIGEESGSPFNPQFLPLSLKSLDLCPSPGGDILGRLLPRFSALEALSLTYPLSPMDLSRLASFGALTALSLNGHAELAALPAGVSALARLRDLGARGCSLREGDGGLSHLLPLRRLTSLDLMTSGLAAHLPPALLCLPELKVSGSECSWQCIAFTVFALPCCCFANEDCITGLPLPFQHPAPSFQSLRAPACSGPQSVWLREMPGLQPLRPPPSGMRPSPLRQLGLDCVAACRSAAVLAGFTRLEHLVIDGRWGGRGLKEEEVRALLRTLARLPCLPYSTINARMAQEIVAAFPALAALMPGGMA